MEDKEKALGFWFAGAQVKIHLAGDANSDAISIMEHRMPEGFSPPIHVHHHEDESFFVLEGQIRFVAGELDQMRCAGQSIHVPRGVIHSFKVISPEGGRMLTITRGGFEQAVRDSSPVATSDDLPMAFRPSAAEQQKLADACARNGINLLGPPLS
jgi:quercetin dioxygenase-like cupin family protein